MIFVFNGTRNDNVGHQSEWIDYFNGRWEGQALSSTGNEEGVLDVDTEPDCVRVASDETANGPGCTAWSEQAQWSNLIIRKEFKPCYKTNRKIINRQ